MIQTDFSQQRFITYAIEDAPFALRRLTVLGGNLMLAAGKLLADSDEQIKAIAAMSTQPAMAGAEQKNAGNLRQEAPARFGDQPRANGTDQSCNTLDRVFVRHCVIQHKALSP